MSTKCRAAGLLSEEIPNLRICGVDGALLEGGLAAAPTVQGCVHILAKLPQIAAGLGQAAGKIGNENVAMRSDLQAT